MAFEADLLWTFMASPTFLFGGTAGGRQIR
jgi:hypothetical protein